MRTARAPSTGLHNAPRSPSRSRRPSYLHHRPRQQCQPLHTSPYRPVEHRSPYRSITQAEIQRIADARASLFPKYSAKERQELKASYPSNQQEAIDLGEDAVNPHDMARGKLRRDVLRPKYIDPHAFSRIQPTIDKKPSTSAGEWDRTDDDQPTADLNYLPDTQKKLSAIANIMLDPGTEEDEPLVTNEEPEVEQRDQDANKKRPATLPHRSQINVGDIWYHFTHGMPEDKNAASPTFLDEDASDEDSQGEQGDAKGSQIDSETLMSQWESSFAKTLRNRPRNHPLTAAQRLENALRWRDSDDAPELAQDIPKIEDPRWEYSDGPEPPDEEKDENVGKNEDADETMLAWKRLAKTMRQPVEKLQKYRMKNLVTKRVVNQTRLGKIDSQYCLYVVGDERGLVGLGEGKAQETDVAARIAQLNAVRNMKPIRRHENRTIFGEVIGKVGAVELKLNARPPGFGLRVSQHVYEIAKCAGLQDLQAKSLRSRNPMNVAKAMVEALQSQKDPEDVARSRGKKLVDVRKVYYAGLL